MSQYEFSLRQEVLLEKGAAVLGNLFQYKRQQQIVEETHPIAVMYSLVWAAKQDILTAKTEYMDKITGLTLGADDYIPKPFNPLELVARVKAQIRRYTQYNDGVKEEGDIIDFGGLLLNRTSHECVYNEVPLTLTPIEFDILWLLCENRGKVISSEELFEKVWNEKYYKNSNNTVMVHIRHLREKMSGPTGKSDFIKTVWGVGYKIEE